MNSPKICARCHCVMKRSYDSPMGLLCKRCHDAIDSLNMYYIASYNDNSEDDDRKV